MNDAIIPKGSVVKPLLKSNYPGTGAAGSANKDIPCMDGTYINTRSLKQVGGISTGLSGAGTSSQTTAAICPAKTNVFSTVAANSGCQLGTTAVGSTASNLSVGDEIHVINHGANPLLVYPPSGGKINNGTLNAALSVAVNGSVLFKAISSVNLVTL